MRHAAVRLHRTRLGRREPRRHTRGPSRRRRVLGLASIATILIAATAGGSAAAGAFSQQAESAFQRSGQAHLQQILSPSPRIPETDSNAPHPGVSPNATPPTTTADGISQPGTETLQLSETGPNGVKLQLFTLVEDSRAECAWCSLQAHRAHRANRGSPRTCRRLDVCQRSYSNHHILQ